MNTRLLLIEDDNELRDKTSQLLIRKGYDVTAVMDGNEGIKEARTLLPDLIVSDIMMPDVTGYEVLERLRRYDETKAIPFIFLTAKVEMNDLRKGMSLGADDYIVKPFKVNELVDAIEMRLEKKREYNKSAQGNGEPVIIDEKAEYEDTIFLDEGRNLQSTKVKDIECVLSDGVYSIAVLTNKQKVMVRKTMKQWVDLLPEKHFLRIHRSTIINLNKITKIQKWFNQTYRIEMQNYEDPLVISRSYSSKIKNTLIK